MVHSFLSTSSRKTFIRSCWEINILEAPNCKKVNTRFFSRKQHSNVLVMEPDKYCDDTSRYKHVQTCAKLPGFHIIQSDTTPHGWDMLGYWETPRQPWPQDHSNHSDHSKSFPSASSEIRYGSSFAPRRNIAKNRESKIAMPVIYSCQSFKAACYTLWYFSDWKRP